MTDGRSLHEKFLDSNADHLHDPRVGAFEVAIRLGNGRVVGPEHLFGAVLAGKPDDEASNVMQVFGVTVQSFERELAQSHVREPSDRRLERLRREERQENSSGPSYRTNPVFTTVLGLAQGFGASRHEGPPASLDYLLAFLWGQTWTFVTRFYDVTREQVLGELVSRGIELPKAALPEVLSGIPSRTIPVALVSSVAEVLHRDYPDQSERGWHIEVRGTEARVFADPSIDVTGILRRLSAPRPSDLDRSVEPDRGR